MPDTSILQLDEVVAGYGMATVLNETSFGVNRHSMTTVIGPNGAGKSTALKAVFGMVKVESGRIVYDGEDIVGSPQLELLNRGIAFVPQGRNIFPRMSVRDNLELGGVSLRDLELTRDRIDTIAFLSSRCWPISRTSRRALSAEGNRRCSRWAGPFSSSHVSS